MSQTHRICGQQNEPSPCLIESTIYQERNAIKTYYCHQFNKHSVGGGIILRARRERLPILILAVEGRPPHPGPQSTGYQQGQGHEATERLRPESQTRPHATIYQTYLTLSEKWGF